MKKIFTFVSIALMAISAHAQETYTAVTAEGLATEFSSVIDAATSKATNVTDGKSVIAISTANVTLEAVGGTTPATKGSGSDINADGTVNSWNDITWTSKNQGDISFYYVAGTGNPYTKLAAEEIMTDGTPTGTYRAAYTFYVADGSNGLPVTGLYYKFTPKVAGTFKVGVWSNKGNRNTFVVDESTKLPIAYTAEGYINGQNNTDGTKKYLTAEEIQTIHNSMKVDTTGVDTAPYVIGGGNQAFWGYVSFKAEANKSYLLFQHSSQIGFQGFTFTAGDAAGISTVSTQTATKNQTRYNLSGQQVNSSYRGMVIMNGQKFINR
jgi:hypothetical protein